MRAAGNSKRLVKNSLESREHAGDLFTVVSTKDDRNKNLKLKILQI